MAAAPMAMSSKVHLGLGCGRHKVQALGSRDLWQQNWNGLDYPPLFLSDDATRILSATSQARASPRVKAAAGFRRSSVASAAIGFGAALPVYCRLKGRRKRKALLRGSRGVARAARARPYPDGIYDPDAAAEYFQARSGPVVVRSIELLLASLGFASKLILDRQLGALESNEAQRAAELTELITDLGPTFIKIGQALSIRADLLSPGYLKALTELQDRVPPFPTSESDEIIESELGKSVGLIFEKISDTPIASASLGQVYKATLRDGHREVAVKVQRPGMEERVALDLFLLRSGTGVAKQILELVWPVNKNQDLVGLIDEWGAGFVNELNYGLEASNAEDFEEAISKTPLAGKVFAPKVVHEASTRKVLTTEWIFGERLENASGDARQLCSVAMNTYLTMLLETGVLHADPHPGNLMVTEDGRLCILDWGCVTSLDKSLQVTYVEHVTHLLAKEYELVAEDLIKIGFVPEGKEEEFLSDEVVAVLASVYSQWNAGGGAAQIDVNGFISDLQRLGSEYGGILRIPPYFFYIARAFAVLEGIGLTYDPQYSVLKECTPYISRRLLMDTSPRLTKTLKLYLYGQSGTNLRTDRIEELAQSYSSYASTAATADDNGKSASEAAKQTTEVLIDVLLSNAGGPGGPQQPTAVQKILLDELASVLGASARDFFERVGLASKHSSALLSRAASLDDTDKETLETTRRLSEVLGPRVTEALEAFRAMPTREQAAVATEVAQQVWEKRQGVVSVGLQLASKVVAQGLVRARQELQKSRSALVDKDKSSTH